MPIVLHPLEQRLDGLGAEVHPPVRRRERVGLVDEEDTIERATDRSVGLGGRVTDILPDEPGAIDLDQVPLL